jgi:hypothetical protein
MARLSEAFAQDSEEFLMTQASQEKRVAANLLKLAEIKELCGPPPVLSTESAEIYYKMMLRFIGCFLPGDFMEQMFIKDLTDSTWEMNRYIRHKPMQMERKFNQLLEYRAQRTRAAAQNTLAGAKPEEVEAILRQSPTELDHADALERGIDYAERLDKLLNAATARRDDVLEQLDRYRDGLGRYLRAVSDEIIDGDGGNSGSGLMEHEAFMTAEMAAHLGLAPEIDPPPASPNSEGKQVEPPPDPSAT